MTALSMFLRAIGPFQVRRVLSSRGKVAVRVDSAVYLTTLYHLANQWGNK